jgi:hypothetical protein
MVQLEVTLPLIGGCGYNATSGRLVLARAQSQRPVSTDTFTLFDLAEIFTAG